MWEPRGHSDMYGCLIVEPERANSDLGVLFIHNEGYSTMCGHGIIGLSVVMESVGAIAGKSIIKIDSPAGQIIVVDVDSSKKSATFLNVPSFVDELNGEIEVDGIGTVNYDLAFGGAYYAYVDAKSIGLQCIPSETPRLIDYASRIKKSFNASRSIVHPLEEDLGFLYGAIFTAESESADVHSRHVCVFAEGEVDRSPTGTGVSARAAILHARKQMSVGDEVNIDSIIGSTFSVRVAAATKFAGKPSIIPEVSGTAHITGVHNFVIDDEDPLAGGFLLR